MVYFAHDTNMRELLAEGRPYPTDFVEIRQCIDQGQLRAGNVEVYRGSAPNIECRDGDLFASATSAHGGWGDTLERDIGLVEEDVRSGWITSDVARSVYGVDIHGDGKACASETERLRREMRKSRRDRSADAREWWKQERDIVLNKNWTEDVYNMFADNCKWTKFREEFCCMWQLPEDYTL